MADLIREIKQRRVLPAVGVYAGSCWVIVEILDRLVERYLLSPYLTDIAFWGLYSMVPAVVLVAWTHGRPGKDRATIAEKVGVPVNLIATLGLLLTVFGGKDLGVSANLITVSNEEGVAESHYVPSESYRRRMAVFFFENQSGDPEMDWLQYGITELLVQDLQQNPFVLANSPWANFSDGFYMRMKQAGFEDGLSVPRSLMREIANDANRQYFVEGSFDRVGKEYGVSVRVWETSSLKQVAELRETGWDLYNVVDTLTVKVRETLGVPQTSGKIIEDLPLVETFGESQGAFKKYVEGLNARLFNNDFEASNAFFEEAARIDPAFVLAWFMTAFNHAEAGDLPSSQAAIEKAQALDYRLPSGDRVLLKQLKYRLAGDNEKLMASLRMQIRLNDDASSHVRLATMMMISGQLEEAKRGFQAALERDPLNLGIYLQLSLLERASGNPDAAIGYARKYHQEKPEDSEAHVVLGDLLRNIGDLDAANEQYLEASLLENKPVIPMLRMATIAMRKGDAVKARKLLVQAEEIADTPAYKGQVRQAASYLEQRLGRVQAAIEQSYRMEEYLRQTEPPFVVALSVYLPVVQNYVALDEPDKAMQALDVAKGMVEPPMDQFLAFGEATIHLGRDNLGGVEMAVAEGMKIIEQFKLEDLKFQADLLNGTVLRTKGDYAGSVAAFRSSIDRIERSVLGGYNLYQLLPMLQAELVSSLVAGGNLDEAGEWLEKGFRIDPSEPMLWVSRARHQFASGLPRLAEASVNYALAIWNDADPEYRELILAKELAAEIRRAL